MKVKKLKDWVGAGIMGQVAHLTVLKPHQMGVNLKSPILHK